jgi:uncharacterized protein (TIGR00730 family)
MSKRICVYAGARDGARSSYREAAAAFGTELARRGYGMVYGGANVGLMGACADAALASGAEVIGILPRNLESREIAHRGLTRLHIVETLHERKAMMSDLSDAFVALPGGCGTLDELFEAITWWQLGIHQKPIGLLDAEGYWTKLVELLDHMNSEGFVRPALRLPRSTNPSALMDQIFGQL